MAAISVLQLRNMATNLLENPPENTGLTEQEYIASLKNRILSTRVPTLSIQSIINTFSQNVTREQLDNDLQSRVASIDAFIPPVHTPVSLQDISL
jgi:hypothetical protein